MEMEIGGLCDEVMSEILDRIPIKQVIRMKCLSKSWCSLISRYRETKPRASSSFLLLQSKIPVHRAHQLLFLQAKEQLQQERGNVMEKLLSYSVYHHINFVGSSHGLLLFNHFVNAEDKLITYVCNTSAKEWQWDTLPPIISMMNTHHRTQFGMGLAYDGVPNHPYKVISYIQIRFDGNLDYHVYSSDTQEWREQMQRIPHSSLLRGRVPYYPRALIITKPHLFWKGMLLCITCQMDNLSNEMLLVYHVQNNSFKLMRLPKRNEHCCGGGFLSESEGHLQYFQILEDGFCVWKYMGYDLYWESFSAMGGGDGEWKLMHAANIRTLVAQHPEAYGPIGVSNGKIRIKLFQPCAFDDDLQILYILLPRTIISYSFETQRLSKVWMTDFPYVAPRSLCIQLNGTNHPLGGDSVLSLPKWDPEGSHVMH